MEEQEIALSRNTHPMNDEPTMRRGYRPWIMIGAIVLIVVSMFAYVDRLLPNHKHSSVPISHSADLADVMRDVPVHDEAAIPSVPELAWRETQARVNSTVGIEERQLRAACSKFSLAELGQFDRKHYALCAEAGAPGSVERTELLKGVAIGVLGAILLAVVCGLLRVVLLWSWSYRPPNRI